MSVVSRLRLLLSAPVVRSPALELCSSLKTLIKPFSLSPLMETAHPSRIKPPNILVYQPSKDTTNKEFIRSKESLETCLTPERYVVYTLGVDDITHRAPWQDNCRLVVVPPRFYEPEVGLKINGVVPAAVLRELVSYVKDGGTLISLNDSVNEAFGFGPCPTESTDSSMYSVHVVSERVGGSCKSPLSPDSGVGDGNGLDAALTFHAHNVSLQGSHDQSSTKSQGSLNSRPVLMPTYPSAPSPPDSIDVNSLITSRETLACIHPALLEQIESNTNQSNNKHLQLSNLVATPQTESVTSAVQSVPGVEKIAFSSGGCAVLSRVDLLPLLPEDVEVPLLVKLKRDVEKRVKFLSSLLSELSLECSEEEIPGLTHTYLVCSTEVSSEDMVMHLHPV